MNNLADYFDVLERLKNNTTINLPKGSKINKDAVSLEAGRKRGSIKKGREEFLELIKAIEEAENRANAPKIQYEKLLKKYKVQKKENKRLEEDIANRELMMLERISQLERMKKKHGLTIVNNIE